MIGSAEFKLMKIFVLVPVYNEGKVFEEWLPSLLEVAKDIKANVVVIDDGSIDGQCSFDSRLSTFDYRLLCHPVNCGVGAAIATGMEYARAQGAELVLTIDGDGQHDPEDLKLVLAELKQGRADIVNGSRFMKKQKIPFLRRVANFLANVITFILSGFWLSDTQTGMKGFSQKALKKLEIESAGYEWCTEIFREASWYKLKVREVPISVKYNLYTLYKGQSFA